MKTLQTILICAVLAITATFSVKAQTITNQPAPAPVTYSDASFGAGLKIMANAITSGTNWDIVGGYGHSLKGKNNLAFADIAYSFNQNVGVVVGYDVLWTKGQHQFNAVKGGVTLQTQIHPLAWTGVNWLGNITGTPFVGDLIATPRGSSALGNIVTTGINFDLVDFSKWSFGIGGQYENRSGQGIWDGNYGLGHLSLSRNF